MPTPVSQSAVAPTPTGAAAAADESSSQHQQQQQPAANHLEVKIDSIQNLPSNWNNESGAPPIFSDHAFRYSLEVQVGETTHMFKNGRVLQSIPLYTEYIDEAKLPPISSGNRRGSTEPGGDGMLDDGTEGEQQTEEEGAAAGVPSELPSLKKLIPKLASTDELALSGAETGAGATSDPTQPPSPQAQAKDQQAAASAAATPSAAPPRIMWALGIEADALEHRDEPNAKKDAKGGKKGAAAPPPVTMEAVKPTLPNMSAPPPCVLRIPLSMQELAAFEEQVEKGQTLNFVFKRTLRPGCPADWEDVMEPRFQAAVKVPLRALADPGATTFVSDVPLEPITPEAPKEEEKGGKKKAAPKKTKGGAPTLLTEELDVNEPHPYVTHETFARIQISCHAAITRLPETRPRPDLQPADMIPKRLRPPRRPAEATKQFVSEVEMLIQKIVHDYRQHVAANNADGSGAPQQGEDSRATFLNFLQTSGQMHSYKQMLVPTVQGIVKEKFIRKPNPTRQEMDKVSNELYTYLLDHLHVTINRLFGTHNTTRSQPIDGSSSMDRWKRLAMEAEVMQEFAVASKYHQERLAQVKPGDEGAEQLPNIWSEYAEFCLRVRDVLKAEQGYREALALDFTHLPSLIGYGTLLLSRSRFKEAEVFLQAAVDISPTGITWGCVALLYDMLLLALPEGGGAEDEDKRTSFKRESKYAITQAMRFVEPSGTATTTPEDAYLQLASHLVNLYQEDLANLCLAKADSTSTEVDKLYARLFFQTQQYEEAVEILTPFIQNNTQDTGARVLLGDVYCEMGMNPEAEQQYDSALRLDSVCASGPAYIRLGNMYVALGKYRDALSAFLVGAKVWPCGLSWLGVGIAYFRLEDITRAEQALNEANILNNLNPKTWAYLALVCLRQKREDEGDQAFNQAIKQGLSDHSLIAEVGNEQFRNSRPKVAEACFRRSLSIAPDDCNTKMLLGRTLTTLKRFEEAKEEFQFVAENSKSQTQRQKAEEQIHSLPL